MTLLITLYDIIVHFHDKKDNKKLWAKKKKKNQIKRKIIKLKKKNDKKPKMFNIVINK